MSAIDPLRDWWPDLVRRWRRRTGQPGSETALAGGEITLTGDAVRRLSEGLTRQRRLAGKPYWSDPALLAAYLLYFWPVSYLQARRALAEGGGASGAVLDLGAGPGPMGLAALDAGADRVVFADRHAQPLRIALDLARAHGYRARSLLWDASRSGDALHGTYDLILLGHLLNELWTGTPGRIESRTRFVSSLSRRLAPGGRILILEPALQTTGREALEVRDRLLEAGFRALAPCLGSPPCPALAQPGDTCHTDFAWSPPPWLAQVIHRAGFRKQVLKMTYQWLTPPGTEVHVPESGIYRVVSEVMKSKNRRLRLILCGPQGRISLAAPLQAPEHLRKRLKEFHRGDLIRITGNRLYEGGMEIGPETRLANL